MKLKKILTATLVVISIVYNAQIPNYVPLSGLQGYWPFTGNANDLSVNANNGTVNGAQPTTDRFGNANNAYSFNGTSNDVSTNYSGIMGANPRAVSYWAKTTVNTQGMSAISWGDVAAGTRFNCGLNYQNNGPAVDIAYAVMVYSPNISASDNNWHHYVYQFSTPVLNQVQVYQDGVLLTQTLTTLNPGAPINTSGSYSVHFGANVLQSPYFFDGQLDDFGIWNRVLTPCEIEQLYKSSLSPVKITSSNTLVCSGKTVTLTASGAASYTWNTPSNNANINVAPPQTTSYTVTGTTANGCIGTSIITITVTSCAGINNMTYLNSEVEIYPNPTTGLFSLGGFKTPHNIGIYDTLGNLIRQITSDEKTDEIDLSRQPPGIYFVKIAFENTSVIKKIIRE